jgi:hypothetical protein
MGREASPNDPKLRDRGARRGPCMVGERRRPEAGAVTAGAVLCSAWFGVAHIALRRDILGMATRIEKDNGAEVALP